MLDVTVSQGVREPLQSTEMTAPTPEDPMTQPNWAFESIAVVDYDPAWQHRGARLSGPPRSTNRHGVTAADYAEMHWTSLCHIATRSS